VETDEGNGMGGEARWKAHPPGSSTPTRGGATIRAGGHAPPPFSKFSVFTVLTLHLPMH